MKNIRYVYFIVTVLSFSETATAVRNPFNKLGGNAGLAMFVGFGAWFGLNRQIRVHLAGDRLNERHRTVTPTSMEVPTRYLLAANRAGIAFWQNPAVIQAFLENIDTLEYTQQDWQRLMVWAVYIENATLIRRFIQQGADPNQRTLESWSEFPRTPLEIAALVDYPDVARVLIENGARVDERSERDITALHLAAHSGNRRVFEVLIRAGANPYAIAQGGISPWNFSQQGTPEFADFARNLLKELGKL